MMMIQYEPNGKSRPIPGLNTPSMKILHIPDPNLGTIYFHILFVITLRDPGLVMPFLCIVNRESHSRDHNEKGLFGRITDSETVYVFCMFLLLPLTFLAVHIQR